MASDEMDAEYIAARRIGDAAVTVISEGTLEWTPAMQAPQDALRQAVPELARAGRLTLGLNVVHVAFGPASIVIDPGCDDPASSWHERFAARWPGLRRSPGLRVALAAIGVNPAGVTHVVITHAHADHFGGVLAERGGREELRFPHARHLIGRKDWVESPARQDPSSDLVIRLGAADRSGLLDTVDEEREAAPGVTVVPAPGETPGHCIVRVRSRGDCFYYVGDLIHHPCEVEHLDWVPANRDVAASRASRRRVFEEAAGTGATVVYSHARFPAWGRILADGGTFRWEPVS